MDRTNAVIIAALVPAIVLGSTLIAVIAWRERASERQNQAALEFSGLQQGRIDRLEESLRAAKAETDEWRKRWQHDTTELNGDLTKANEALKAALQSQREAQASLIDLANRVRELESHREATPTTDSPAVKEPR